jgi:hypothetical protein
MYSIYTDPKSLPTLGELESQGKMWFMSCDIGKRNFAYTIVEVSLSQMKSLVDFKNDDSVIKKIYSNTRIISMDLQDFVGGTNIRVTQDIFNNITNYLDSVTPYFDLCKAFVLEKQLKKNPEAQRIEQHVYSYLVIRYKLSKDVISLLSRLKYTETGIPPTVKTKYYRKKWAWVRCKEILEEVGDQGALEYIFKTHKTKKDDLSDTLLQVYAFCRRVYVKERL